MNHMLKINRQNVRENIQRCQGEKQVCLMVKANCYGMGNQGLKMLLDLGYTYFGVSTLEEALNIRSLSASAEILIVSYIAIEDIQICKDNNITFTVYNFKMLSMCDSDCKFHIKIDTNMGRLGFQLSEVEELKKYLLNLQPEGIYTHLACASDREKTEIAIANFQYVLGILADIHFPYIHIHNTFGALNYQTSFDNIVRIGIGIWGYFATQAEMELSAVKLQPSLALELTISHLKEYDGYISYDHIDYVRGNVITSPLGYYDGLSRCFQGFKISNFGKIVGKINMCQHMVLLNDGVNVKPGSYYQLFAKEQLYELTEYGNTSVYEFLVGLSPRISRVIN